MRRAKDRYVTDGCWLDSKHSFSFSHHYDQADTHHGLLVNNDEIVSAGTGILHSEKNDAWRLGHAEHDEPVHFIQMWVVPDDRGIVPGYEQLDIEPARLVSGLVSVASGMERHANDTAIRIKNRYAALYAARLEPGQSVQRPDAPFVHLFVPRGIVELEGTGVIVEGDAVRFSAIGGQRVSAV